MNDCSRARQWRRPPMPPDESLHFGAALDTFIMALNRHIEEGPFIAASRPAKPDAGESSHNNISGPMQLPGHWQSPTHGNVGQQSQQKEQHLHLQSSKEHSSQTEWIDSATEQDQHVSHQPERDQQLLQVEESHSELQQRKTETNSLEYVEKDQVPEQNYIQDPKLNRSQNSESQHHPATPHSQQVSGANDANSLMRGTRAVASIPLDMLISILSPNLNKDRAIQLSSLLNKLRTNEISKEDFLRVMRTIVGDQMVRQAADKVQLQIQAQRAQDAQTNANQYTLEARAASQQRSSRGAMFTEPQLHSHISSATQPLIDGIPTKTPPRKLIGQKKPLETGGALSPLSSKKQKTLGAFLDQSIEQLNDVTAASGVNIQEEEEQLLSAPMVDSQALESTRRVVQEEEDRLILQKGPLQKKLMEIISQCGLEGFGSDVERCLSLCVEERLRGLISYLIRFSKQRVDIEKTQHRFVVTSDVQRQILVMNRKSKQEWGEKQAKEAEKLRKLNESEGNTGAEAEKEDGNRSKIAKVSREEDDNKRTTAANVAARAAVGGDDMLSKWQLMAEQARQKSDGVNAACTSQPRKTANQKALPTFAESPREQREAEKRGPSSGGTRKIGATNISVKDVIAVLEREPQMSKSELIYRLYGRLAGGSAAELPGPSPSVHTTHAYQSMG